MLGVYIHIPFCNKICTYCDFCKILYNKQYINSYLDNLEKEIKSRYHKEAVDSIYIGGGTPSCLDMNELKKLFSILDIFNRKINCEYTIECNIEDINQDKLNLFKMSGINRISVGVESFNLDIQKILGRMVDEDIIKKNINLTKKYFDNINIDLIYGVNNDKSIVIKDIDKFLELDVSHISCYSLIIEENTKLWVDKYQYIQEDIDYEMFDYIRSTLLNYGYHQYEISNYAKDGYESVHNKNYWLNGNYYGFGLSAVSKIYDYRIMNTKNMSKYLNGKYENIRQYEDSNISRENDLILGLRMICGIDINLFNHKYNDNLLERNIIKKLIQDEYLEIDNNKLRCKEKYIYLLNSILEKILGSDL